MEEGIMPLWDSPPEPDPDAIVGEKRVTQFSWRNFAISAYDSVGQINGRNYPVLRIIWQGKGIYNQTFIVDNSKG